MGMIIKPTEKNIDMNITDIKLQKAVEFIANLYGVTEETVKQLYMDEVENYLWLLNKKDEQER